MRGPLMRFLQHDRRYRGWVALSLLLSCASILAQVGLLAVSGWFITAMGIAGAAGLSLNYFTPAAIIRALAIIRTGGRYAERLVTHDATLRMTARFRDWLYGRLAYRLVTGHSAEWFSRLRGDVDVLERFFLLTWLPMLTSAVTGLVVVIAFACLHPTLAVPEAALLLLAGVAVPLWQQRAVRQDQQVIGALQQQLRLALVEMTQGMAELLVYGQRAEKQQAVMEIAAPLMVHERRVFAREAMAQAALLLAMGVAVLAGLLLVVPLVKQGVLPASYAGMVPLFCLAGFDTVAAMPAAWVHLAAARGAAARVFALVDTAAPSGVAMVDETLPFQLEVALPALPPRLKQPVAFTLTAGEGKVVIGPSGAGKSSLVEALTGLLPLPPEAVVRLGGVAVQDAAPESWWQQFAVAEQRPYLFAGTLRQNLQLAAPQASDDALLEVCTLVGLEMAPFAGGLDEPLGEHGARLSGGQARRVALARAMLKPAPCLILDEPTEGLDAVLAAQVMQAILARAKARGQAVVLITHQPRWQGVFATPLLLGHGE